MDNLSLITCLCLILLQVHGQQYEELDPQEIKTILDAHNHHRGTVTPSATDMYKMEWSDEAASNALAAARKCEFAHSPIQERKISQPFEAQCGENIHMSSADTVWRDIVDNWASEKKDFVYGETSGDGSRMVGHYTQIVWANSHLVGCAKHYCHGTPYPYYSLCQYCPPGNIVGKEHRPYESGTPCAACRDSCEDKLCKMNLLAFVLICLTTVLPQVTSQDVEALDRLSCMHKSTQDYIVDRHNELRSTVTPNPANMLKVKWNVEAAKNAEKWAKECKHAHSTPEQREISSCSCGENLYMASRPHEWKKAIQAWYDEVNDFIYGTGPKYDNAVIGHYTQMVYYRTDEIGCAIAYCPNQSLKYYFVCQYCPAGNTNTGIHTPYEAGESCARCINNCENRTCTNACPHHDAFGNCEQMKEMKNECDGHDAVNDEEYYDYSEGSDEGENVKFDMKRDCGAACFCEHEIK